MSSLDHDEMQRSRDINLSGFTLCTEYLSCIFKQLQLGRPLTDAEIEAATDEANARFESILESYEDITRGEQS